MFTRIAGLVLLVLAIFGAYYAFSQAQPWRSGALVLLIAYAAYLAIAETWNPFRLAIGTDDRYSLSKLQFFLWTLAIGFGVGALLAKFHFQISEAAWHPELFVALGFSSLTALSAKAVTTRQVASGEVLKTPGTPDFRQFLLDDSGRPDLTKFQMLFWTVIAIVAFVGALPKALEKPELPGISNLFLVLMGLADGTYLGTKLVTLDTPRIFALAPAEALIGTNVVVHGAAFGASQAGSQILIGGVPMMVLPVSWADNRVEFTVPRDRMGSLDVQLIVAGRVTNVAPLNVVPLRVDSVSPTSAKPGAPIDIVGVGFGDSVQGLDVTVGGTTARLTLAQPHLIRLAVPAVGPAAHPVQVKRSTETSNTVTLTVT